MILPFNDKSIFIRFVAWQSVLRQCATAPSVDAANAVDIEVDIHVEKTVALDVLRMTVSLVEFLVCIIAGIEAE